MIANVNERKSEMTKRAAKRIEEALQYFTPAALGGITLSAKARALAVQHNPELDAAVRPDTTRVKRHNTENWQAWVYGGSHKPKE